MFSQCIIMIQSNECRYNICLVASEQKHLRKVIQSSFSTSQNGLTHLRHINIIPRPHQNPFQTKSHSRNLSSEPLRSTKYIEEPPPEYRSIFFVISRAWWDKSVSKRFKGKAVSLSVSPVSHFEGLELFFVLFLLFCWLCCGCKKWASHFTSTAWSGKRPPCRILYQTQKLMPFLFIFSLLNIQKHAPICHLFFLSTRFKS